MRTSIQIVIMAALCGGLTGCVSFGPQEPQRYYVLDVPSATTGAAATSRAMTLLIAPTTASSFYDTREIVYTRAPGTRAYYQLHAWTERAGPRLTELLVMRLEHAGSFQAVAKIVSGVRGDVVLNTQLTEFYHDATNAPGNVKTTVTAELTDMTRRIVLARRTFTRTVAVATYDAPGAVQAFNLAVGGLLDDIAAWVEAAAPRG